MIKTDMIKVMAALAEVYPKFEITETKTSLFYELLKDLHYPVVQASVKKHMLISEFAPTIADIRKLSAEIITPQITAADGWGEVTKLMNKYGSCRFDPPEKLQKVMDSMTEATRIVVQYIGWQKVCESENIEVIRGQFMKMYGQVEVRQKEQALLPTTLQEDIKKLGEVGRIKLIGGTTN